VSLVLPTPGDALALLFGPENLPVYVLRDASGGNVKAVEIYLAGVEKKQQEFH
jgi:hypothetical protein